MTSRRDTRRALLQGLWRGSFQPLSWAPLHPTTAAHPTHDQCPYCLTSPSPGPATHPVLVGIDRGIANSPPKPGHIPRLQRGGHHQECHPLPLTVISTLLTKPPQPTLALTASPSAPTPPPLRITWVKSTLTHTPSPKPASCPCLMPPLICPCREWADTTGRGVACTQANGERERAACGFSTE